MKTSLRTEEVRKRRRTGLEDKSIVFGGRLGFQVE